MEFIEVNGVGLRYELSGAGERTLVLVHEMGGSLESWNHVLPRLGAGRRVLRYDTRGAGMSEKARPPLTFDTMSDDLAALLDALGLTAPVAVAGCAVGAGIALSFALRFPSRAGALVAMAPATGMNPERAPALLARVEKAERAGMRAIAEDSFAGSYPPVVRHDPEHFRAFRARWLGNDPASYGAIYRMLIESGLTAELPRIACPTLIVAGNHDALRPPSVIGPMAATIPGAEFQALETGHFMAIQTPGIVAEAIDVFLNKNGW